ncbi:hypothetical protein TWF281_001993 [Arthrobotrys megalospora]
MRRARLVINREGLAPARIIWPLAPAIAQNPRYSVYDLLKDVNESFPLDEGACGLEDYTIEIAGCDLVHYMPIAHLVDDKDEITIRPLTRTELRERRKGGRRQISKIGRVLLDGVAPGRLFMAPAPDRPRITGSDRPVKRRKISNAAADDDSSGQDVCTWKPVAGSRRRRALRSASGSKSVHFDDEDEDQEEQVDNSSAMVLATEAYADEDDDDDDEDDDDFDPDGVEDEEADDDSDDDENEQDDGENDGTSEEEEEAALDENQDASSDSEEDEEEESAATADLDQVLKRLSGTEKEPQGEKADSSDDSDSESSDSSSNEEEPEDSDEDEEVKPVQANKKHNLTNGVKAKELSDSSSESSSSESEDSDGSEDESFQDSSAESSSSSGSDSSSDEDEDEDDDDYDDGTKKTKKEIGSDEPKKTKGPTEAEKPEEVSSKIPTSPPKLPRGLPPMVTTTKSPPVAPLVATTTKTTLPPMVTTTTPSSGLPPMVATTNPPFKGTSSTRTRNQRRKDSKRLDRLVREGALPAGSTKEDLHRYMEQQQRDNGEISDTPKDPSDADTALQANDVTGHPSGLADGRDQSPKYTPMEPLEVIVEEMEVSIQVPTTSQQQQSESSKPSQTDEPSSSPVGANRRRPGVSDATKRTLLGSLGLRLPRNQAEDEKQREDWKKKNSKLVGNKSKGFLEAMAGKEGVHSRFDETGEVATEVPAPQPPQDPEAWKQKIQLSAVECDEEYYDDAGDKMPVPSFPFDQNQLWKVEVSHTKKSKKKKKKNKRKQDEEKAYEQQEWNPDIYDDSSMQVDSAQRPGHIERSTQGVDEEVDDLPPVPANLSEYPMLKAPVLPESIVVFTRLVLDARWSPTYVQTTIKVLSVQGSKIEAQVAKRDRPKAVYDEETGERVYGRFHMPGTENDDAANGIEVLDLNEMFEGRVIKEGVATESPGGLPAEKEIEIDRVPETVLESVNMDKDNIKVPPVSQIENENVPMLEAEDTPVLAVPNDSIQSSSFVEPPFQTNGSDGHVDTDDDMDDIQVDESPIQGEDHHDSADITSDRVSKSRSITPIANAEDENLDSSAEAHRYDDAPSQGLISQDDLAQVLGKGSLRAALKLEAPEPIVEPEEPVVQVPGTPSSDAPESPVHDTSIQNWDLSVDISALDPADAEIVEKMVKVKQECPEDSDLLREALKPFHHPETQDEVNISVDISPPVSPIIKKERLSTQEALDSPVTPLKDITGRSTSGDNVEHGDEPLDESDNRDQTTLGSGTGYLASAKSRCSIS